jgi:lysophospholipase L1-like esterase
VVTLGINDITGGQNLAAMQARMQTVWAMLAAHGVTDIFQTTITPVTTSTDAWATVVNQTATATNGVRVSVNDWLRSKPAGITGILEVADLAETARNSGIWKAGFTADGTHPNVTGHAALAAVPLGDLIRAA